LNKLSLIVKQKRKAQGKSQYQSGELACINYQMIGRLENGTFVPSIKQIESLMEVLDFG
jgi:transcriptional regulator with XRE-family HTH domain